MMIRKSMISIAAAAAIVTGFTGCSSDTNNTSTTSGNNDTISNPKVTVTGTVMDTNGNPIPNVTVFAAGMETTTDAGGIYVFEEVPTVNTANSVGVIANRTRNGVIQVTVAAPAGYLGATVQVTPESQQISSGDPSVLNGGQTNPNTNFIDGYIANAGTAVLPKLNGTVHGVLENVLNGTRPAGVEVCLDLTANAFAHNNTNTASGDVSYATDKYCDTTDDNGVFDILEVPSDATLAYNLADWNLARGQAANVLVEDTVVTNINELLVTPILPADNIAPVVASVVEGLNPNTNGTVRMMLVDDARTSFTLNFSEPIAQPGDLPDSDFTDSVVVYVAGTRVNATAVYNGSQLTVTLPTALADNQLVDVHLVVADFQDAAGNFLTLNGGIGYDGASANTTLIVRLQAFNDINLNAPAVEGLAQQMLDENGNDDLQILQLANTAFNDVLDGTGAIEQMNNNDDDQPNGFIDTDYRLSALASELTGQVVNVIGNVPRVTFAPSTVVAGEYADAFIINLVRPSTGANIGFTANEFILQGDPTNAQKTNLPGQGIIYTPANPTSTAAVEFVLAASVGALPGDVIQITPLDGLGYAGTMNTLTLVDNVEPTTILQQSYHLITRADTGTFGFGGYFTRSAGDSGSGAVPAYGGGGENSALPVGAVVGTPFLGINPGILDNITNGAPTSPANNGQLNLEDELTNHNTLNTSVTPAVPFIPGNLNVYDTTAWTAFNTDASLARTVGVAFSEDADLNGITPNYNGTVGLSNFANNPDVLVNVNGRGAFGLYNSDLINMDVVNVMSLANNDHGSILDFAGIADNAGNIATTASVVIEDEMPPMVTMAEYTGSSVIITFNEAIKLVNNETKLDIHANGITGAIISTALYTTAGAANWVLSNGDKTLTIDTVEFSNTATLSNKANWTLGDYAEPVYGYGTTVLPHLALDFDEVSDTITTSNPNGNSWDSFSGPDYADQTADSVLDPRFAIANTVPNFALVTQDPRWAYDVDTNRLTATFTMNQPITYISDMSDTDGTLVTAQAYDVTNPDLDGADLLAGVPAIQDLALFTNGNGLTVDEGATPAIEGGENNSLYFTAVNDLTFNTVASTLKVSNGNRTVTLTLVLGSSTNPDNFIGAGASDLGTIEFVVGKGNASDSSEDNKRLKVILNRPAGL